MLSWWRGRKERKSAAYAESRGYLSDEELTNVKRRFRPRITGTGGLPEGEGVSPTGTPIDFTADEKPPKY